jgi:uncharacterized protein
MHGLYISASSCRDWWLFLAADKGHLQAEALLGQTLFSGRDGVQPQRARGLMWLALAREAAIDSKKDKWIIDLYDKAVASANDEDRQDALAYLKDHLKRRNCDLDGSHSSGAPTLPALGP